MARTSISLPCHSGGRNGSGGAWRMTTQQVRSSGAVSSALRYSLRTDTASSNGWTTSPDNTCGPIASPAVREVLWGYPRAFVDRHRGGGSRSAGNPSELERPEQASNGGANRRHQADRAEQDIAAKLVQDEVAGNDRSRKNELPIGDCPYGTRLAECKACDQASCDRCQQNDDGPKEHVGRIDQYEAGSLQWHDHQQGY